MPLPQTKNFSVSIVGGGVCGLTCAIGLAKEGVPVDIFESAVSITLLWLLTVTDIPKVQTFRDRSRARTRYSVSSTTCLHVDH